MNTALILVALIIMCCIFFNKLSDRIGLPMLLVFIVLGMVFGSDGLVRISFSDFETAEEICSAALIFIIFYGGFGTKWSEAKKVAGKSLLLSSAGVILTAALTGGFCYFVLKFPLMEGLLLGAVLSSTDAASVFSILRSKQLNLKYGTASVLELESGSNDPWAYMLTIILLSVMKGQNSAGQFVYTLFAQVIFGVAIGAAIAVIAVYIMNHVSFDTAGFDTIFVAAVAILSYALPSAVGGNGYLSAYIVGIVLGNARLSNKKVLVHFFDGLTSFAQILIFFLLGLTASPSEIPKVALPAIAIVLFITFAARPLSVLAVMSPFKAPLKQQALISWAGLRGATSIVFAIMAMVDDAYTKSDLFHIVFLIVLISIGLQGTLLPFVSRKLDMIDDSENVMKTFSDYTDETAVQFIRISVNEGGKWSGKCIKDIKLPAGILVVMIMRGKERIIPTGKTVLRIGDVLILSAEGFYDDSDLILHEVAVSGSHEWCGKRVQELPIPKNTLIVMIKRSGKTLIPNGRIRIKSKDVLVMTNVVP
ncbi:MAG: potassium/proton antiporter [Huintestinicola sp.]